jgi:hypothetical protein
MKISGGRGRKCCSQRESRGRDESGVTNEETASHSSEESQLRVRQVPTTLSIQPHHRHRTRCDEVRRDNIESEQQSDLSPLIVLNRVYQFEDATISILVPFFFITIDLE